MHAYMHIPPCIYDCMYKYVWQSLIFKVEETANATETTTNLIENDECLTNDSSLEVSDEFDCKHGIIDSTTPRETHLRGRYKRSFAYYTFRERLPNTLNALLNNLTDNLKGNNTYLEVIMYILQCKNKIITLFKGTPTVRCVGCVEVHWNSQNSVGERWCTGTSTGKRYVCLNMCYIIVQR